MMKKRWIAMALISLGLAAGLAGCGGGSAPKGEKPFVYMTTGYGVDMGDAGLNPHKNYSGWSAVRYGVGETLFKFSDSMEPTPWLAESYQFLDPNTVEITLKSGITFSNGNPVDGAAVKACLDHLIAVHDRAPRDMHIDNIEAEGNKVKIHTSEPCPSLINYLCDPYGAIIDMKAGADGDMVIGTGPYVAEKVSDTEIDLKKNDNYWGGKVHVAKVKVKSVTDGGAMTAALKSGDADATYGLPYASYPSFTGNDYTISSVATSRSFFGQFNMHSDVMKDIHVRRAISQAIDKDNFVKVLLDGHGEPAEGPFPKSMPFGDGKIVPQPYDVENAKRELAEAGWKDTDGDGYVDKDGKDLTVRWLTYPGRMELPLLAESAQESLKKIGIKVDINNTSDHLNVLKTGDYDVYVSALVTAPTGDPEYFFTTCALDSSAKNRGFYHSSRLEELEDKLHTAFAPEERTKLAIEMQQVILDDYAFFFASHLQMGIVARKGVTGLTAHPCDYYEITSDLDVK